MRWQDVQSVVKVKQLHDGGDVPLNVTSLCLSVAQTIFAGNIEVALLIAGAISLRWPHLQDMQQWQQQASTCTQFIRRHSTQNFSSLSKPLQSDMPRARCTLTAWRRACTTPCMKVFFCLFFCFLCQHQ